jgi:hypothetical protein
VNAPICPFSLTVEPMAAMLNFEIADDPTYSGLEIQRLDDDLHGQGIVVLLVRRDNRLTDVYRSPGLRLERSAYAISAGVGEWVETDFEVAQLEASDLGVRAELEMRDVVGRTIKVSLDDRDSTPRRMAALLAPVSAAIEQPESMMLVWMPRFDLARAGAPLSLSIDGRAANTGRLQGARLHGRQLVKYASDLVVVRLNPRASGSLVSGAGVTYRSSSIESAGASTAGHTATLHLDPPMPDLRGLLDGTPIDGSWRLAIDDVPSLVSGTWQAVRHENRVELVMDSTAKWRPGRLPLLMRVVTSIVPTFRRWPTTYLWRATVELSAKPTISSRWERKSGESGAAYQRVMRTT